MVSAQFGFVLILSFVLNSSAARRGDANTKLRHRRLQEVGKGKGGKGKGSKIIDNIVGIEDSSGDGAGSPAGGLNGTQPDGFEGLPDVNSTSPVSNLAPTSNSPSEVPSWMPSRAPISFPTLPPTIQPTGNPTATLTSGPTQPPTSLPTMPNTLHPTSSPTPLLSEAPTPDSNFNMPGPTTLSPVTPRATTSPAPTGLASESHTTSPLLSGAPTPDSNLNAPGPTTPSPVTSQTITSPAPTVVASDAHTPFPSAKVPSESSSQIPTMRPSILLEYSMTPHSIASEIPTVTPNPTDVHSMSPTMSPSTTVMPSEKPSASYMPSTSSKPTSVSLPVEEGTDGSWTCDNSEYGVETMVKVDFEYKLWTEPSFEVESRKYEVERRLTERVAETLLACSGGDRRRYLQEQASRRHLLGSVVIVSSNPEDELSGSCDTGCTNVKGYMTIGSTETESETMVKAVFCAVVEIVSDPAVLTPIATSIEGVNGVIFDQTSMPSCLPVQQLSDIAAVEEEDEENIGARGGGSATNIVTTSKKSGSRSIGLVVAGAAMFILVFFIARRRHKRRQDEETKSSFSDDMGRTDFATGPTYKCYPTHEREVLLEQHEMVRMMMAKEHRLGRRSPSHSEDGSWSFDDSTTCDYMTNSIDLSARAEESGSVVSALTMTPSHRRARNIDDDYNDMPSPVESYDSEASGEEDEIFSDPEEPPSPVSAGEIEDDDYSEYDIDLEAMVEDSEDLSSMVRPPQQSEASDRSYHHRSFRSPITPRSLTPIKELSDDDEKSSPASSTCTSASRTTMMRGNETPRQNNEGGEISPPISPTVKLDSSKSPDPVKLSSVEKVSLGVNVAQFVGGDVKMLHFASSSDSDDWNELSI